MPAPATGNKRARGTGSVRQRRRGVWQIRWETGSGATRQYHSEDEAFDGLEWPEDEVVPATKCPDGHWVEWDERYSPPPPPNHP